jgi:hypothetical protein
MFPAVPLPTIRSSPLYIRHWYMSCKSDDSFQARSRRNSWTCFKAVIKLAWHIPVPNVQWGTPFGGQRNCRKHVDFLDKNKFGKLVCLLVLLTHWGRVFFFLYIYHRSLIRSEVTFL